jgi:hypothetical protein
MAASDLLKGVISKFRLNPAQTAAVFAFFDTKVSDPTTILTEETISYYVSQDPAIQTIFDTRFAGNKELRDAGKPELSYSSYITREQEFKTDLRDAGFPAGFYDSEADIAKLISGETSRQELQDRAKAAYVVVKQADPVIVSELKRLYSLGDGDLAAYFLDPTRAVDAFGKRLTGQDLLRRTAAAQIGAQAQTQAGIGLSAAQAESIQTSGVSTAEAQKGFAEIGAQQELFNPLQGEQAITQEQQIGGTFGTNAEARKAIAARRRSRQAAFETGGGFASAQGASALGTVGQ